MIGVFIKEDTREKEKILFLSILFLILLIWGMNIVFSSSNIIRISNVVLNQKSQTTESEIVEMKDEKVKMETIFHKLDDSVIYKITIQNTDNNDYTIKGIKDNNNNAYIDYEYYDFSNLELKANGEIEFLLKIKYNAKLDEMILKHQQQEIQRENF